MASPRTVVRTLRRTDEAPSDRAVSAGVRGRVWLGIATAAFVSAMLRLWFGPEPQDSRYHLFADTRSAIGLIPHAGDVLTNITILAAAVFGWKVRPRMLFASSERIAIAVLIGGTAAMAAGSAYYHWNPLNPTLALDRIGMMLALMPVVALLLADRVSIIYGNRAVWPLTLYAVGTVLFWAWTESVGTGDLWPYVVVRFGAVMAMVTLFAFRTGIYSNSKWILIALALQVPVSAFELLDRQIWNATGQIASGHNLKHFTVGVSMFCVFAWLRYRTHSQLDRSRAALS